MHRQREPKRRKSQPTLARTIRTSPAKSQPGARRAARLALISTVPWCRLPRSARDRNAVAVFRRRRFNYKAGLSEIALPTQPLGFLPRLPDFPRPKLTDGIAPLATVILAAVIQKEGAIACRRYSYPEALHIAIVHNLVAGRRSWQVTNHPVGQSVPHGCLSCVRPVSGPERYNSITLPVQSVTLCNHILV